MVLEEEVAGVGFAEGGVEVELAGGDEGAEGGGFAVVFEDLDAVEPVLAVVTADDDAGGVPFSDGVDGLGGGGGDEVVERGDGAIAVEALFGVGVEGVVEDLVLEADGGAVELVGGGEVQVDEVHDAGVGSGGDAEVGGELEVGVLAGGDNVSGVSAFFASVLGDGEEAVVDLPAGGGEGGGAGAVPAGGGGSVEEQMPACGFFLRGEGVGGLAEGGEGGQEEEGG